jgi:Glycosyl hydrolase family 12
MSQLMRVVKNFRRPHPRRNWLRAVIAIAAAASVIGLTIYFQSDFRTASRYTISGAVDGKLAVVPADHACNKPTVIPIDPRNAQSGVAKGNYYVTNDSWNAGGYSDLSQRLHVCNYDSWYAIASMNNDTGDGAVKTSPNVQETWYPTPTRLSRWKSITSQFSDVPPGAGPNYGIWEYEYDIWLNGLADSNSTEIMIWTANNGQAPNGSPIEQFTDAGRTYMVYYSPPPKQYIAFVAVRGSLSGNVNLLHFFNYAISKNWIPASSMLYQICHGVELVSTNGKPEKFAFDKFSITMRAYS